MKNSKLRAICIIYVFITFVASIFVYDSFIKDYSYISKCKVIKKYDYIEASKRAKSSTLNYMQKYEFVVMFEDDKSYTSIAVNTNEFFFDICKRHGLHTKRTHSRSSKEPKDVHVILYLFHHRLRVMGIFTNRVRDMVHDRERIW